MIRLLLRNLGIEKKKGLLVSSTRNKTIKLNSNESLFFESRLLVDDDTKISFELEEIINKTILGNSQLVLKKLPSNSIDLIIVDPPYNLTKKYNNHFFYNTSNSEYES